MHPRQDDVGRHLADHMGIMMDAGAGIAGQPVGLGGGPGGEVGGEEGVQTGGRIIGDLFEADSAGAGTAVPHLDGADDEDRALMAAPAAAGGGSFLLRHGSSVSSTSTRPASRVRPGASMLRRSLAQSSQAQPAHS